MNTEELLRTLPLPLALLLRRAVNGKSAVERHNNAYYLAEATLKLAASARIGVWIDRCLEPGGRVAHALETLTLPSLGHWLGFLCEIDTALAERRDLALLPLGETVGRLGKRSMNCPAVDALVEAACSAGAVNTEVGRDAQSGGLLGFFRFVVAYRNEIVGHGAQRRSTFYDELAPLWVSALSEILVAFELFGGLRLAHTRLIAAESGDTAIRWQDLTGCASLPLAKPPGPDAKLGDGSSPVAGNLYWVGPGALIPIHPLAVYREDELEHEAVGILNRTSRRTRKGVDGPVEEIRRADYLDYATGENLAGHDARAALTALLGKLRGRAVSSGELREAENLSTADTSDVEPIDTISAGATIGDFELHEEVGRGGMGIVYRAQQRSLRRVVALKVLPPAMAADPVAVERFRREVAALARTDHPNVVKVLTYGVDADRHYFAMEFVEGADLAHAAKWLSQWKSSGTTLCDGHLAAAVSHRESPVDGASAHGAGEERRASIALATGEPTEMPTLERTGDYHRRLARLFAGAALGLHDLHERGVIHRDVKPGNLMLTVDGERLVVMDLGLAKTADESKALTRSDVKILGTLRYMPPEQLVHKLTSVDRRADVYSLGATLYELATGRAFFGGETEAQLVHQVLSAEPMPPRAAERSVPRDLATIITVATAKNPESRYTTAAALAADLLAFAEDRAIAASPPSLVRRALWFAGRKRATTAALLTIVLSGLGAVAGWWWFTTEHVSYCAEYVLRRAAPECVGRVSSSRQRRRHETYRFHEQRGRVIRVDLIRGAGMLFNDFEDEKFTPVSWEYRYRDDGAVEGVVVRNTTAEVVQKLVYSADLARVEIRDRNDGPLREDGTDISVHLLEYDSAGFVKRKRYANLYGTPRLNAEKVFGYQYETDALGLVLARESTDFTGAVGPDARGIVRTISKHDDRGLLVETAFLGKDDRPLANDDGCARILLARDADGNSIETKCFGADGKGAYRKDGCSKSTTQYDYRGNAMVVACFGVDDKLVLNKRGFARATSEYDSRGNEIEQTYFGTDGNPVHKKLGQTRTTQQYDDRGHVDRQSYFGIDGKPVLHKDGVASFKQRYDKRGNNVEIKYFGIDDKPVLHKDGYASVTRVYDERGDNVKIKYFGIDGKLVVTKDGYAQVEHHFDERGDETLRYYFGVDGKPILGKDGYARFAKSYDATGKVEKQTYFDAGGREVPGPSTTGTKAKQRDITLEEDGEP